MKISKQVTKVMSFLAARRGVIIMKEKVTTTMRRLKRGFGSVVKVRATISAFGAQGQEGGRPTDRDCASKHKIKEEEGEEEESMAS